MNYNINYINLKYTLINCFLIKVDKTVLDISYSVDKKKLTIQIVVLDGFGLSNKKIDEVKEILPDFDIVINELYLTKEQFNESKGDWQPKCYKWLDYLLLSKAEVL